MLSGSGIWRWIFWGLNFRPGSFLGFGFYPHSIIPVTWSPEYPPPPPGTRWGADQRDSLCGKALFYLKTRGVGWGRWSQPSTVPGYLNCLVIFVNPFSHMDDTFISHTHILKASSCEMRSSGVPCDSLNPDRRPYFRPIPIREYPITPTAPRI